jgi:hypothetical protein
MIDEPMLRLAADEHPLDLVDVVVVFILGVGLVGDSDRILAFPEDRADRSLVALGLIEKVVHRSDGARG